MTALDPRLGEIEARLEAIEGAQWDVFPDPKEPLVAVFVTEDWKIPTAGFVAAATADVAYLLAELRKRDDALARVEAVAADLETRGNAVESKGHNGSINGYRHEGRGVGYQEGSRLIRAAVTAAMGGGE